MRWQNFLKPWGRLDCRTIQVGLSQGTAKLFVSLRSVVDGRVGRPTLAGNRYIAATNLAPCAAGKHEPQRFRLNVLFGVVARPHQRPALNKGKAFLLG